MFHVAGFHPHLQAVLPARWPVEIRHARFPRLRRKQRKFNSITIESNHTVRGNRNAQGVVPPPSPAIQSIKIQSIQPWRPTRQFLFTKFITNWNMQQQ